MRNIIKIKVENNQLKFIDEYIPIVCGNTNYCLEFYFDEEWILAKNKIAIIEISGDRYFYYLENNIINLPYLKNYPYFLLALICTPYNNEICTTSALKFELEKNIFYDEFSNLFNIK